MADSVKGQLLRGVAWNFIEKVLMKGVQFFIGVILARLLSPSDYGLIGMLAVFIAISNVFIEGGLTKALIQKQDCIDVDYSTVFVSNIGMSLVIYAVLFVSAPWIANFYEEPILKDITRIFAINFILGAFNIVQRAKLMAKVDFKSLAQINVISAILSGLVGVGMAFYGLGVWALVGQAICSTIVLMVLFPLYSKWSPSIRFSVNSFKRLFGFGSKLMVTGTVSVVVNNISTICIGKIYRSSQLGFYTRAFQYPELISSTLYDVLGNVTFPVLSELQDDRDRFLVVYKKSLLFTAMVVMPVMILGVLLARPLVLVLLTAKWLPCVALMQWLFMSRIVIPLSAINLNVLNALGRSDLFMKTDLSKLPMNLLVLAITIPIGVEAICIGLFCTSWIAFFINAYYPGKLLGYGGLQQLKDWRYIIVSVLLMVLVVTGITNLFDNAWLQLIAGGVVGLGIYIGCCFLFKVIDDDMLKMLKIKK